MNSVNERKEALRILTEVCQNGAYSSIALEKTFRAHPDWDSRSRALITNLVHTALAQDLRLASMVALYSAVPYRKLHDYTKTVLKMAAAQLLFMDRIPQSAVIHEAVQLMKSGPVPQYAGFVNAVLRAMQKNGLRESWPERSEDLLTHCSVRYSMPRWILALWAEAYGEETAVSLARCMAKARPVSLRVNTMRVAPETVLRELGGKALPGVYLPQALRLLEGAPTKLESFAKGLISVQDESSMLAVRLLDPQEGERILDVCAAPGGKSAAIAERMSDRGEVRARDIHEHKLPLIRQNAERLGLTSVHVEPGDGLVLLDEDREAWDRILLDAPCSGLGVLRNKPDLKMHVCKEQLPELAALQARLLDASAGRLKKGGVLVYSTCTLDPLENEDNVRAFLARHPEFEAEPIGDLLPETVEPERVSGNMLTVLPKEEALDGFFCARFHKTDR